MSMLPVAPVQPDFHKCGNQWGGGIVFPNCWAAASKMPHGNQPKNYVVNGRGPYSLPWEEKNNSCRILLTLAGPGVAQTHSVSLTPDEVRGMTFWVIQQCVLKSKGVYGGYATKDFANITNYLLEPTTSFANTQWPPTARFLTVTVDAGRPHLPVGDWAVDIPIAISATLTQQEFEGSDRLKLGVQIYGQEVIRAMRRPSQWWVEAQDPTSTSPLATNDTTYQCDAGLGTPNVNDCSNIDLSQLGAPSDSLIVAPGIPKVLTSNTCTAAVSSDKAITISWDEVKTALEMVMALCVINPLRSVVGGRVFNDPSPSSHSGSITPRDVNVLNVFPPSVNLTLYQTGHYAP